MDDTRKLAAMFPNCKDLSTADLRNFESSELGFENDHFPQFSNRTRIFNFSEEYIDNILENLWSKQNLSSTAQIALIVVYSFLIVGGLIANVLISFVVARRKQMHTARNLYIVNLTVSDISLCLICMPFTLVMILRRQWTLGPILCKLVSAVPGTNIMVSVGTITAIALDRYFTICKRTSQEMANTKRKVLITILLIWIISILVVMPICFFRVIESLIIDQCVVYEACIEDWPSDHYRVSYAAAVLLVMAVIPPLVVGIVHARIAKHLNNHARIQKDSRRAQKELERNKKTTFLLSGIVIIFTMSWLPLGCFSLLADLESSAQQKSSESAARRIYTGLSIVHVIAMSSAISNPIVYGWMNSNIRHEFLQLLPFKKGRNKNGNHTTAIENDTTRTQLQCNSINNEGNGSKEATALLVFLNETGNSLSPSRNSETL